MWWSWASCSNKILLTSSLPRSPEQSQSFPAGVHRHPERRGGVGPPSFSSPRWPSEPKPPVSFDLQCRDSLDKAREVSSILRKKKALESRLGWDRGPCPAWPWLPSHPFRCEFLSPWKPQAIARARVNLANWRLLIPGFLETRITFFFESGQISNLF